MGGSLGTCRQVAATIVAVVAVFAMDLAPIAHAEPAAVAGTQPVISTHAATDTQPATGTQPAPAELDSLLAIAMRANPRLIALQADVDAALDRVPPAGALPDPTLTYSYEGGPLSNPSPTAAMVQRLELQQMIHFPGKQGLMKSMAAEEARMAGAQLDRARLEVAAELHRDYRDLQLLQATLAITQENQTTLRTTADVARTRYQVGAGRQADLLRLNVEIAKGEARIANLEQRIPVAVARVNAILNRPAATPLPAPPMEPALSPRAFRPRALPDLETLEPQALAAQPMLRMKERKVAMAEYAVRLARREGWPDLMLGAGYMAMKEADDSWMGMVGITLPIWRGNKTGPMRRAAEQDLAVARAEWETTRNETSVMLREAWGMCAAARETVRLYDESILPQVEQAFAATQAAYANDTAGFLDVLDALRSSLQTRIERQEALTDFLKSWAELGLAAGDGAMLGVTIGADHD
jgi:outer membrane protein, heavy metal efflux system